MDLPQGFPIQPQVPRQTQQRVVRAGQGRARIGQLLRLAKDDEARVFEALAEARDLRPADPEAWLSRALTPAAGKPSNWAMDACFGGRA